MESNFVTGPRWISTWFRELSVELMGSLNNRAHFIFPPTLLLNEQQKKQLVVDWTFRDIFIWRSMFLGCEKRTLLETTTITGRRVRQIKTVPFEPLHSGFFATYFFFLQNLPQSKRWCFCFQQQKEWLKSVNEMISSVTFRRTSVFETSHTQPKLIHRNDFHLSFDDATMTVLWCLLVTTALLKVWIYS